MTCAHVWTRVGTVGMSRENWSELKSRHCHVSAPASRARRGCAVEARCSYAASAALPNVRVLAALGLVRPQRQAAPGLEMYWLMGCTVASMDW